MRRKGLSVAMASEPEAMEETGDGLVLVARTSRKPFFGPLIRIELISGAVIVGTSGDTVSMSPEESEIRGGRSAHAIWASRSKYKLLGEIMVPVDAGSGC